MNKRKLLVSMALLASAFLVVFIIQMRPAEDRAATGHAVGTTVQKKTNVLLIIADDIGVDKVGVYADDVDPDYRSTAEYLPDTPVIDGLADAGIRFTDAWANPICSPTRAAIFTGNYGFRTGVGLPYGKEFASPLDPSETTIAEALQRPGYTSAMFGKWHLGENELPETWGEDEDWDAHAGETLDFEIHPITHGWDMFCGTIGGGLNETFQEGYYDWVAVDSELCEDCEVPTETDIIHFTEYATIQTVDDALSWIGEQEDPWMVSLTLHAPHTPFEVPPEGCSYRPEGADAPRGDAAIFEEMVECMDQQIGVLLDGIEDLDDTLVIFVGDNGTTSQVAEGIYDDGRGKGTLYESGVRVPLIIADGRGVMARRPDFSANTDWQRSPRSVAEPGSESADPVHAVDIFATIIEAVGARSFNEQDSISMMPLMSGAAGALREVLYSETFGTDGIGNLGIRKDNWKMIVLIKEPGEQGPCRDGYKLFDLSSDRFEQSDLSSREEYADALADMRSELDAVEATADETPWFAVADCE